MALLFWSRSTGLITRCCYDTRQTACLMYEGFTCQMNAPSVSCLPARKVTQTDELKHCTSVHTDVSTAV